MKSNLIPIAQVDRAVRRIESYGSAVDRAALAAATKLAWSSTPDPHASRQAILDIAEGIKRPPRAKS